MYSQNFVCCRCGSTLSAPVEACPVCGEITHRVRLGRAASASPAPGSVVAFPARRIIPTRGRPDDDPGPSAA